MTKPKQMVGRPSLPSLQRAQQSLHERQLMFVTWESTPEGFRKPETKKELAKAIGVSEVTLWRWAKDPKVQQAVRWMTLHHAGDPARVSNVINFIYETVNDSEQTMRLRMEAAREFLKAVGVYQTFVDKPGLLTTKEVSEIRLDELSDEEVWDLYNERAGGNDDPGVPFGGEFDVRAIGGPEEAPEAVAGLTGVNEDA